MTRRPRPSKSTKAAFASEPDWLKCYAKDKGFEWARIAWRRAAAQPNAWFDEAKAQAIVENWPTWFRLTDDRFAGEPFYLSEWQEVVVRLLVGWKIPVEDTNLKTKAKRIVWVRLFRRLLLWVPRKNGKSEFLAALALLFWAHDAVTRGQGYVFARKEEQARVIFDKMKAMIGYSPKLAEETSLFSKSIFLKRAFAGFELLSGAETGTHGKGPYVSVGDEMHEWRSTVLADNLRQGMGIKLQPIELAASTAGLKTNIVGKGLYDEAVGILDGRVDDPGTLAVIYAADEEDDPFDEKVWARVNPQLGLSLQLQFLRQEARKAKSNPRALAHFKCYHLNQWVDSVVRWLPTAKWDACTTAKDGWKKYPETLKGRLCYGAFDLSATRDITALVLVFPPDDDDKKWRALCRFWVPQETMAERIEDQGVPYAKFVAATDILGRPALETTPGDVVDQEYMARAIVEAKELYDLQAVGYDPWNATKLITDLQNDYGMDPEFFRLMRQGIPTLGEPSKVFERQVFGGEFDHGGNPVLRWMAQNAAVKFDDNLNFCPTKKRSAEKIDGIVSSVMAVGLATFGIEPEDASYLETENMMMV